MRKPLSCAVIFCLLVHWSSVAQTSSLSTVADESVKQTNALTRWERAARENRKLSENITWLTHEPMAFLMRRGDHFDDEPERYERMGDPANIKRMADAGVRYAMIYFYKGFGLEYEQPSMQ